MNPFPIPKRRPPLRRCYWVLDGILLAGAYPGKEDPREHKERIAGLYNAGMRTFISLMEPHEKNNSGIDFLPYQEELARIAKGMDETVVCKNFPIKDRSITSVDTMRKILDAIDECLSKKEPVYVHCFGGIGRTGTVICCWLLRHRHATLDTVFEVLKELRTADIDRSGRDAPENEKQKNFVLNWLNHDQPPLQPRLKPPPATRSDWFTELVGFTETTGEEIRRHIRVDGEKLISDANGESFLCGKLEIPSLDELRSKLAELPNPKGALKVSETVADVQALHREETNAGSVFQVASQFNLLEMVSPDRTPDEGVGIYQYDRTQGPACAIACGAGTIYRNYFVDLGTQIGQTKDRQIDCLAQVGEELGNQSESLWRMRNGYALPSSQGLKRVSEKLGAMSIQEIESLRGKLRIGVHWDTQVTLDGCKHAVTQAYCSALPVAYCSHSAKSWEPFARLVLEGAYEATFIVAILNAKRTSNRRLYLTSLGGGAFGNETQWIYDAMRRSIERFAHWDLDVRLVSYGNSNPQTKRFIQSLG